MGNTVVESIKKDIKEIIRAKQALNGELLGSYDSKGEGKGIADQLRWDFDTLSTLSSFHAGRVSITSGRPVLGKLFTLAKRLARKSTFWLYQPLFDQLTSFNNAAISALNKMALHIDSIHAINMSKFISIEEDKSCYGEKIASIEQNLTTLRENIAILQKNNESQEFDMLFEESFNKKEKKFNQSLSAFAVDIAELKHRQHSFSYKYTAIEQKIIDYHRQLEEYRAESAFLRAKLAVLIQQLNSRDKVGGDMANEKNKGFNSGHWDWVYHSFEQHFRGPEELIRERQKVYLDYIGKAQESCGGRVLDVGSGRGEMLEILKAAGIPAAGVDFNEEMVCRCRDKGLEAEHGDGLAYLAGQADNSLSAVMALQVVEHLNPDQIWKLINSALIKLKPGGLIVLETVNPDSYPGMRNFYLDLTHKNPIPSATLRFLLEAVGFRNVEVRFSSPVPEECRLAGEDENTRLLNDTLFGYQDYAVLGWR